MPVGKNAWFIRVAGFVPLMLFGSALGLPAQQTLPPAISALFPANVTNITGQYFPGRASANSMSGGNIYGEIPNTRDCNHLGKGSMKIELSVWAGEGAKFMMDILRKGIPERIAEDRKRRQEEVDSWSAQQNHPFIDQWGPVQEEAVPGGEAIWFETEGPCVEDENPRYHTVSVTAYSVQGSVYAKVEIGLRGELAVAKAMLLETLDKIAKTDFTKLAKH